MKKRFLTLSALLLTLLMLSGCSVFGDMSTTIKSSGKGNISMTVGLSKDLAEAMEMDAKELAEMQQFDYEGETFYGMKDSAGFSSTADLEKLLTNEKTFGKKMKNIGENKVFDYVYASKDTFYGYLTQTDPTEGSDMGSPEDLGIDEKDLEQLKYYATISITLPKKIVKTNGKLSDDQKTVSWDYETMTKNNMLYATTVASPGKISVNVKNKKIYSKAVTVKSTGKGSMYLDGSRLASGKKVSANGKHTLVLLGQNKKKTSITFTVDTKAPEISGAKNGKTYKKSVKLTFKDVSTSVKSVTVNGKKLSAKQIKSGYTIKKKGTYKVIATDAAGNKKTIKFTIKTK